MPPVAARARATTSTDSGPSENRFDESRGAGHRERRRLEPHERALGGQPGVPVTGSRRPGGDHERERQLTDAPSNGAQQAESQVVSPLAVVEEQRKRPIVGQLDDHPPQRVDDLIAARPRPARIRQRAVEREQPQPRRPIARHAAPRRSQQLARGGERDVHLELVRGGEQDPGSAGLTARAAAIRSSRVLPMPASPSISTAPPWPDGRRVDDVAEYARAPSLARSARPRRPLSSRAPRRTTRPARYRGRYRARARRGRGRDRRRWLRPRKEPR